MKIFHNKKFGKVVMMMALLPLLASLPGCNKPPEHTVEDIRSVSVSCGHMDYSHSYSFYLRKTENGWLLDAEFATDTEHPRVGYEECPVTEGDVKKLLTIVQEQNLTEQLRRYKKPIIKVQVLDETTYYSSISFTDGEIMLNSLYYFEESGVDDDGRILGQLVKTGTLRHTQKLCAAGLKI